MFTCGRLVDKATTNDEVQTPGMVYAEAVQLVRTEPANAKRLVLSAIKKLASNHVIVRLKGLQFLLQLCQNGPAICSSEIKLHTAAISDCIGWRGKPHETRGFAPYIEMKEAAQTLLDYSFTSSGTTPVSFASVNMAGSKDIPRTVVSTMESYGSEAIHQEAPSLEPRSLDPLQGKGDSRAKSFFKNVFQKKTTVVTTERSDNLIASSPTLPDPTPPETSIVEVAPSRGQFDRLGGDLSWARAKSTVPAPEKVIIAETPTSRLLKVIGNRALPTNSELIKYKGALTPDAADELKTAISDPDWKVKVRAAAGLECYGEKFGFGPLADLKILIQKLQNAPQSSLRSAAVRLYEQLQGVVPTPVPSAFNFAASDSSTSPCEDDSAFSFT
jgi:hypothetical protein